MSTIPSISEHIDEKIINKVIQGNFATLAPSYFTLTSNWFVRAYDHWKDIDKFVIVIYLIHQDLIYFRQNGLKINYDTFYAKKSIEIDKIIVRLTFSFFFSSRSLCLRTSTLTLFGVSTYWEGVSTISDVLFKLSVLISQIKHLLE